MLNHVNVGVDFMYARFSAACFGMVELARVMKNLALQVGE